MAGEPSRGRFTQEAGGKRLPGQVRESITEKVREGRQNLGKRNFVRPLLSNLKSLHQSDRKGEGLCDPTNGKGSWCVRQGCDVLEKEGSLNVGGKGNRGNPCVQGRRR